MVSILIMGKLVLKSLPGFGPIPLSGALWMAAALLPVSALFGALCLALAAFARSTKEGQYYLVPLLFVTLPLAVLPVASGMELNLGNSLIPITGMVLLLRATLEGNAMEALEYLPTVSLVTRRRLRAGHPLGRRAVQLGIGALPRGGTLGRRPLAAAPLARSQADRPPRPARSFAA